MAAADLRRPATVPLGQYTLSPCQDAIVNSPVEFSAGQVAANDPRASPGPAGKTVDIQPAFP